jgi:putative ABC transport system permease protein
MRRLRDVAGLAALGVRSRPGRAALSALGVTVGVAAIVAVVGISDSSRADLIAQLDRLGTNLLTVTPGRSPGDEPVRLPDTAPAMIRRITPVQRASSIAQLDASVRRNAHVSVADTGAISVAAAQPDLLSAVGGSIDRGRFLDSSIDRFPTVVLGRDAATQLGIAVTDGRAQLILDGQLFVVVGVLRPVALAPELDRAALIGFPEAATLSDGPVMPTTVYVRTDPDNVPAVQAVLAATANPAHPTQVSVARPSDALAARAAADSTLTALFVGLGAVSLVVGGLGIANVMVTAVLERRGEIGLRRALGARRGDIAAQFVAESLVLAVAGGAAGMCVGTIVTAAWSQYRHWPASLSVVALAGGMIAAAAMGAIAGFYPALRAARLSPAEALRSPT